MYVRVVRFTGVTPERMEEVRARVQEGEKVFSAMDPGETPGTRASVDMCEVAFEERM